MSCTEEKEEFITKKFENKRKEYSKEDSINVDPLKDNLKSHSNSDVTKNYLEESVNIESGNSFKRERKNVCPIDECEKLPKDELNKPNIIIQPNSDNSREELFECSTSKDTEKINNHQDSSQNKEKKIRSGSDDEDDEKDFEPTVDMMLYEFDDERTMEEEEALEECVEDTVAEAEALEQEAEVPLTELLKRYGYNTATNHCLEETNKKENIFQIKDITEKQTKQEITDLSKNSEKRKSEISINELNSSHKKGRTELARFYEAAIEGRSLRSSTLSPHEEDEDSSREGVEQCLHSDEEENNRDYSWKKAIMIGPTYQALVPNDVSHYDNSFTYDNKDELLWDPHILECDDVESYLTKNQEINGSQTLPLGEHIRDDEQALYQLLQCGSNINEALRRHSVNSLTNINSMSLWSEEECRSFELGLRLYGKDFYMIQQQKVRTRSVGELVQFYYLWKKTERHDVFATATRLEKKKYVLHPGTTDYMDRFVDEQDPISEPSASNYNSLFHGTDHTKTACINSRTAPNETAETISLEHESNPSQKIELSSNSNSHSNSPTLTISNASENSSNR